MSIEAELESAFGAAAPEHFAWQTQAAVVAEEERALVDAAFRPLGSRLLDLGCAEGATLYHLGAPPGAVGLDLFEPKLAFARERLPQCHFVQGSVYDLPFEAGRFDHVIVRDVVHHLDRPTRFVEECRRVLAPGGRVDVLEPCRNNPLILLHALSNKAERGELRSTPRFLTQLLAPSFRIESVTRHQPLPLHRVAFHPSLGRPELAHRRWARDAVKAAERIASRVMPRAAWAYIHVRAWVI